jgi:Rieske Fe-S protein
MPLDEDKYPAESDRRRFVKGVVGSAALTGLGGTGAVTLDSITSPTGEGGGATTFQAMENTAGPAPRGMPVIPLEIDDEGYIKGRFPEYEQVTEGGKTRNVSQTTIGGVTYGVRWFQYCGIQSYAGIQPDADQDNYFRYGSDYDWHADKEGEKVHVDDFTDYESWTNGIGKANGKPASATWRSQGLGGKDTIPVQIIRSAEVENMDKNAFLDEATPKGFIANLNKCTHFCCVPAFKASGSAKFNAENDIYCPCHQSVYDPFNIVEKTYTALPRPDE